MKAFLQGLALLAFFAVAICFCSASDAVHEWRDRRRGRAPLLVQELIDSIADKETGNNPRAIGKLGELGRCQFLETTWYDYTTASFALWAPVDCELTRKIERAHFGRLCGQLTKAGVALEPETIAAAWNFGAQAAKQHAKSEYATRVANLYRARIAARTAPRIDIPQ